MNQTTAALRARVWTALDEMQSAMRALEGAAERVQEGGRLRFKIWDLRLDLEYRGPTDEDRKRDVMLRWVYPSGAVGEQRLETVGDALRRMADIVDGYVVGTEIAADPQP